MHYITEHIGTILTAVISALVGFLASRPKERVEIQKSKIENVEKALVAYELIADNLTQRLAESIDKLNETEKELEQAKNELKEAKKELDNAKEAIRNLEVTVERLTEELSKYKQLNKGIIR